MALNAGRKFAAEGSPVGAGREVAVVDDQVPAAFGLAVAVQDVVYVWKENHVNIIIIILSIINIKNKKTLKGQIITDW